MEIISSDAHTHVEPETDSAMPAPFKIRWGRTSLALVGLAALFVAVISGLVALFGGVSVALPILTFLVFAGAVASLRLLAIRDADRRAVAASLASTTPLVAESDSSPEHEVPRESVLFDGASGAAPVAEQKALTAEELRQAALRVAAKGAADAKLAHTQTLAEGEFDGEKWEPIEVPTPGYVTAARAAAFETPISVPVAPKSAGTSIKADMAGVGVAVEFDVDVVSGDVTPLEAAASKPVHALNNLDDVLQRRRA